MQFFAILALVAAAVAMPAPAAEPVAYSPIFARGCTPGTFTCATITPPGDWWILTCDSQGNWQRSAECGGGCKTINGNSYCA